MTPELEAKIRAEFDAYLKLRANMLETEKGPLSNDLFTAGFLAGRASVLEQLEQVGVKRAERTTELDIPLYRLSAQLQEEKEKK